MKASFRMEIEASQQQNYAAIHSHLLDVKNKIQVHLDNISRKFDNLADRISAVEESVKAIQQELADMPSPAASESAAEGSPSSYFKRSRKKLHAVPLTISIPPTICEQESGYHSATIYSKQKYIDANGCVVSGDVL